MRGEVEEVEIEQAGSLGIVRYCIKFMTTIKPNRYRIKDWQPFENVPSTPNVFRIAKDFHYAEESNFKVVVFSSLLQVRLRVIASSLNSQIYLLLLCPSCLPTPSISEIYFKISYDFQRQFNGR